LQYQRSKRCFDDVKIDAILSALAGLLPELAEQDPALAAKLLSVPSENYLAEKTPVINPVYSSSTKNLTSRNCSMP
jgi:hypothetical protein